MRKAFSVGAVAVVALVLAPAAAEARLHPRLDLVERSVGTAPVRLAPGDAFAVTDVATNRGGKKAPASTTQYFLTSGQTRLVAGSRRVPALKPHRSSRASTRLTIPGDAPAGDYAVAACADATRSIREANERNNCRTAAGLVSVRPKAPPPTAADSDHDGTADSAEATSASTAATRPGTGRARPRTRP
jgi:hypothetical protein